MNSLNRGLSQTYLIIFFNALPDLLTVFNLNSTLISLSDSFIIKPNIIRDFKSLSALSLKRV